MENTSSRKWSIICAALLMAAALITAGAIIMSGKKTVGRNVKQDRIYDFYYTDSTSAFPPYFQRYRFTVVEGEYFFYHETREGDHFPLTEADITVSGTLSLTGQQWDEFYSLLENGTVRNREDDVTDGDSGPWTYLYWKGDRGRCREFTFESYAKRLEFEELCLKLREQQINSQ